MQSHEGDSERAVDTSPVKRPESASAPGPARTDAARLLQLQRTAGNAAAVRLLGRERSGGGGRRLQRLLVGEDPLPELADPAARGLIYGMSPARTTTSQRLALQDARLGNDVFRTIDAYNLAAGINDAFGAGGKKSATAVFKVREALAERNPVAAWQTHFPTSEDPLANPDLRAWIEFLDRYRQYVGLYDLGEDPGKARLEAKYRFGKNFKTEAQATGTTLTPRIISNWLGDDKDYDEAGDIFDRHFTAQEQDDLGKWVFSAFFRRTSKLGILFTVLRGETIHMNIAADPTYDPSHAKLPAMQVGGLDIIERMDPDQAYGRAITLSEYRYAQKVVGALGKPENMGKGYGRINIFSEIKDPPAPVVVAAPHHQHKKKFWKPWTWFK
jgi:hypothetical protein